MPRGSAGRTSQRAIVLSTDPALDGQGTRRLLRVRWFLKPMHQPPAGRRNAIGTLCYVDGRHFYLSRMVEHGYLRDDRVGDRHRRADWVKL